MGRILIGSPDPLPPQLGIGEELDIHSADYRPCLEAHLASGNGVIPICHRHPIGCSVEELEDGMNDRLKVLLIASQCRRPHCPIQLRIGCAVIQGSPKAFRWAL